MCEKYRISEATTLDKYPPAILSKTSYTISDNYLNHNIPSYTTINFKRFLNISLTNLDNCTYNYNLDNRQYLNNRQNNGFLHQYN